MRELPERPTGARPATRSGAGVVVIAVYGIFALAATGRAAYQISTKLAEAPLPYLLSGLAAALYVVVTVALVRATPRARGVARAALVVELVGVVGVGAVSFVRPDLFPDATVWSHLGEGYGYLPLVLPVLGLVWLARTRPSSGADGHGPGTEPAATDTDTAAPDPAA